MTQERRVKGVKVLMVLDSFFPPDIRVRKEYVSLIEAGYKVTLVCYRRKGQQKEETILGCRVIRSSTAVSGLRKGLIDMYNSLFFINPILRRELNNLSEEFDIIHVHDLPASNTALRYGKKHKLKSVLDRSVLKI